MLYILVIRRGLLRMLYNLLGMFRRVLRVFVPETDSEKEQRRLKKEDQSPLDKAAQKFYDR
jgi:hypothetical protein